MNEQLKELLETLNLSEDTVTAMQAALTEALEAAKEEGKKEAKADADKEKEELEDEHDEEVKSLKENANAYGDYLKEQANAYGEFLKENANSYGELIKESVSEKMKEYAEYSVEEFITENKARFVETEEYERMKAAFGYIREAFERNAFDVRDDVAVIELQESLQESTAQYESLFEDLSLAKDEIDRLNRQIILEHAVANLADTQKEKVNKLVESVSFDSIDEYKDGIAMIVEQAKGSEKNAFEASDVTLTENVSTSRKAVDSDIARYMSRPGLL